MEMRSSTKAISASLHGTNSTSVLENLLIYFIQHSKQKILFTVATLLILIKLWWHQYVGKCIVNLSQGCLLIRVVIFIPTEI